MQMHSGGQSINKGPIIPPLGALQQKNPFTSNLGIQRHSSEPGLAEQHYLPQAIIDKKQAAGHASQAAKPSAPNNAFPHLSKDALFSQYSIQDIQQRPQIQQQLKENHGDQYFPPNYSMYSEEGAEYQKGA